MKISPILKDLQQSHKNLKKKGKGNILSSLSSDTTEANVEIIRQMNGHKLITDR